MPHYIAVINKRYKTRFITLPKIWADRNLSAGTRYIVLKDNADGTLTLIKEEDFYEKVLERNTHRLARISNSGDKR